MPTDDQMQTCPRCSGTGKRLNAKKTGARMRKMREAAGISLRELATKITPALCHQSLARLERGWVEWTQAKVTAYQRAVESLSAGRTGTKAK